ncbi:hypothetical protein ACD591_02100 [Rufibacter glacialis]|uniref:Uncharacterized protein n=1 Tax=Rufibacter glacialis TaxID=1259555 RepID=A0A5M8QM24_9BACT|nr:hypothetical protein [Rufibacter glacialis]KAA6435683.1 hypothetical protein FOE74_07000 [Rufibacter glacialis]
MKTHNLLYIIATSMVILGAALRITHTIEKPTFDIIFWSSIALSLLAAWLKKKYQRNLENTTL